MKPSLLGNMAWSRDERNVDSGPSFESSKTLVMQSNQTSSFDLKIWGLSLLSLLPWAAFKARETDKASETQRARTGRGQFRSSVWVSTPLRFRPYVSKVPWHTGARAFLSQFFPRYGYYCGPNWSSGKDNGNLVWDRRPIDWLDYCCYCHDIGYDTHDQAKLLEADFKFLECLERKNMETKGDPYIARVYKTMCTTGLKNVLIPYRTQLINLQSGSHVLQFGWLSNARWKTPSLPKSGEGV